MVLLHNGLGQASMLIVPSLYGYHRVDENLFVPPTQHNTDRFKGVLVVETRRRLRLA